MLDAFRIECQQAVETAKLSYLMNLGNKVNNPGTSQKSFGRLSILPSDAKTPEAPNSEIEKKPILCFFTRFCFEA